MNAFTIMPPAGCARIHIGNIPLCGVNPVQEMNKTQAFYSFPIRKRLDKRVSWFWWKPWADKSEVEI